MIIDLLNDIALLLTGSSNMSHHTQLVIHSIKSLEENAKGLVIEIENIGKNTIQLDSCVNSSFLDDFEKPYYLELQIQEKNLKLQPFDSMKLKLFPLQSKKECNWRHLSTLEFRVNSQEYIKFACNSEK